MTIAMKEEVFILYTTWLVRSYDWRERMNRVVSGRYHDPNHGQLDPTQIHVGQVRIDGHFLCMPFFCSSFHKLNFDTTLSFARETVLLSQLPFAVLLGNELNWILGTQVSVSQPTTGPCSSWFLWRPCSTLVQNCLRHRCTWLDGWAVCAAPCRGPWN